MSIIRTCVWWWWWRRSIHFRHGFTACLLFPDGKERNRGGTLHRLVGEQCCNYTLATYHVVWLELLAISYGTFHRNELFQSRNKLQHYSSIYTSTRCNHFRVSSTFSELKIRSILGRERRRTIKKRRSENYQNLGTVQAEWDEWWNASVAWYSVLGI